MIVNTVKFTDPVHDPERTPSRMDAIPGGHHPEWTPSRWTPSRMDTIPHGHNPEWTPSRMYTIPNDTIPSEHLHLYPVVTLVFYSYCLVRSFLQRRGFK